MPKWPPRSDDDQPDELHCIEMVDAAMSYVGGQGGLVGGRMPRRAATGKVAIGGGELARSGLEHGDETEGTKLGGIWCACRRLGRHRRPSTAAPLSVGGHALSI